MRLLTAILVLFVGVALWQLRDAEAVAPPNADDVPRVAANGGEPAAAGGDVAARERREGPAARAAVESRTASAAAPPSADRPAPIDGPCFVGRVFALSGAPLALARVVALPVLPGRMVPPAAIPAAAPFATTDATGRFVVAAAGDGACDLGILAAGFSPFVATALLPGGGDVIVRLHPSPRIAGVVLTAGVGTPDLRVEVWLGVREAAASERGLGPGRALQGGTMIASTTSVGRGEFAFDELPAGRVLVTLAPRHGSAREWLRLQAGASATVELQRQWPVTVSGRVTGGVAGATVMLCGGVSATRTAIVGAEGRFAFAAVTPGRYLAAAVTEPVAQCMHAILQEYTVEGRSTLADLVAVEHEDVSLTLAVAGPMLGTVEGVAWIGGRHASGVAVRLVPVSGRGAYMRSASVRVDGTFRLEGVPRGDYDARLLRLEDDKVVATRRCRVVAGNIVQFTISVP